MPLASELAALLEYQSGLAPLTIAGVAAHRSAGQAQAPSLPSPPEVTVRPTASAPVVLPPSCASTTPRGAFSLQLVREELGDCTRCKLHQGRKNIVFGVGNPEAQLVFVGEGPGADEDRLGEPFVGRAGELLDKMIGAMGLERADIYICNVVKCRPPNNRDPEPEEVAACQPFLEKQLAAIQPQVIVTLGKHAAHAMLKETTAISRLRGKWRDYRGTKLMPTFHPAYLLRNPADKRLVWGDLKAVMQALGLNQGGAS